MALADPQSITIDSVATDLPRVETQGTKSVYRAADQNLSLTISHQRTSKKRVRHSVRIDIRDIVADPLTAENDYEEVGVYVVIDEPEYGFSDTTLDNIIDGFLAWFTTANIAKVLGSEH